MSPALHAFREGLRTLFAAAGRPEWIIVCLAGLVLAFCYGCSGVRIGGAPALAQECPQKIRPVWVEWSSDLSPCSRRNQNDWGACVVCGEAGANRFCTIHSRQSPSEMGPDILADEAQHVFGCVHVREGT